MRLWFDGGAGGNGDPGDGGGSPPAAEVPSSAPAPEAAEPGDAQTEAARSRQEMLEEAAEHGRRAAREEWERLRSQQPAPPAAQPPTAVRGGPEAELWAEKNAIDGERAALNAKIEAEGWTANNIVAESRLNLRESRFLAQVGVVGLQMTERRSAVAERAPKDDAARTQAWKEYASQHANVDPDVLRDAFETKWAREHPAKTSPAPASPTIQNGRPVNVSGPSEVTAGQAKARTMTREAANQHRASLRAEGRDGDAASFDREIRTGKVLIKG